MSHISPKKEYTVKLRAASKLMYEEWQPIGFGTHLPEDEYDPFAVAVLAMVASGSSEEDVFAHLVEVESNLMATKADVARARVVARKLFALLVPSDA